MESSLEVVTFCGVIGLGFTRRVRFARVQYISLHCSFDDILDSGLGFFFEDTKRALEL